MKLKVKLLHKDAKLPFKTYLTDAGLDITSVSVEKKGWLFPTYTYYTGIAIQPTLDYWIMIAPRSSVTRKLLWLANSVGIIDPTYTGQIIVKYRGFLWFKPYKVGERLAQIIPIKNYRVTVTEVEDLIVTDRSTGGFGSTGV